jgi:hypothetical protein
LLREGWVLVITSVSECLPVSFLEAESYSCAILGPYDPDGFATRFGYHVVDGDCTSGLRWLLEGNWREVGGATSHLHTKWAESSTSISKPTRRCPLLFVHLLELGYTEHLEVEWEDRAPDLPELEPGEARGG